ncbi:DUF930 domain-containing protein [Bosea sp. 117]|uniref:DUF930 domain-containing protein n=1 Tax=Bosea sp. 117 TaxID=1125973 RepID=UPI0020BDAF71|nr:DUF930 domain-containing protein [Bosea sp. 117]
MQRHTLLILAAAMAIASSAAEAKRSGTETAAARDKGVRENEMLELDPTARIEQRCNARGMGEVGRDHRDMKPDELVAYAYKDTKITGSTIKAPGAAIRSGSTWYHMSYQCETTADGLDVRSFDYSLGDAIPKDEWGQHYLVAP